MKIVSFILPAVFLFAFCATAPAQTQIITTVAGNGYGAGTSIGGYSGDGGLATDAELSLPYDVAVDSSGNIYIADSRNQRVRKVSVAGIITTFAGTGVAGYSGDGGAAVAAQLNSPMGLAVDAGGYVYIADAANGRIRKVSPSGIITTVVGGGTPMTYPDGDGGPATAATLGDPIGVTIDRLGNMFIVDNLIYCIRKVNTAGIITTIAGGSVFFYSGDGGPATAAGLYGPTKVAVDTDGNVYISGEDSRIRMVNTTGIISTLAGDGLYCGVGACGDGGPAAACGLSSPMGLSYNNSMLQVGGTRIRKINLATGIISNVAGNISGYGGYSGDGGPATLAELSRGTGVATDRAGNIYIADEQNNVIRKIAPGPNHPPHFTGGHSLGLTVCENTIANSINSILSVIDSDAVQTETWSLITSPAHGTLAVADSMLSTGGVIIPSGMYYTPAVGYSGSDSFRVRVTDGIAADTTTVHVTVNHVPPAITGSAAVCPGLGTLLTDAVTGGTWSGGSTAVATIVAASGVLTGGATGTTIITYTLPTGCYITTTETVNTSPPAITGVTHVCPGAVTALTDAGGGSWSSSNTAVATVGAVGVVGGVTAGTATIVCSVGAGCAAIATVTVSALPANPAATGGGITMVCAGDAITLTDAAGSGAWSSSNTSIASAGSATGIVSGVSGGTAIITYTASTTGCTARTTITVNALPLAILGTLSLCSDATTILSDHTTGGSWSNGSTLIATVGTAGTVSGLTPGTSVITYAAPVTGCSITTVVTINALPAVPSTATTLSICVGAAAMLTDAASGGLWSVTGTVAEIGSATGLVNGMAAGTATVSYTLSTGCARSTVVTVDPLPTITGPTAECVGTTILESVPVAIGSGGTWSNSVTSVATIGTDGIVTGVATGTDLISYTTAAGCKATMTVTVSLSPTAIIGASVVCANDTATLGDVVGGGVWSSSNTATATMGSLTGTVTGIAAGTTIVTYSLGTGCTVTKILNVNAVPAVITGSMSLCVGLTTALSETMTGGVWSSGRTAIATVATTGVVTGESTDTATISYTLSGCATRTVVTVNPIPAAIVGAGASICVDMTNTLTDAVSGGTWGSGSTGIATIDPSAGVATGIGPGTASITYTLTTGCVASAAVTVNVAPDAISGGTSMCIGSGTSLSDATTGGIWSSGSSIATVSGIGHVSGTALGTATISYTAGGCAATVVVTVNSLPSPLSNMNVCMGSTSTLTDLPGGGTWSSSNTGVASIDETSGLVTSVTAGVARVTYSLGVGCAVSASVTVESLPDAITGMPEVCLGYLTSLADATGGGVWSSSNTAIATITGMGMVSGVAGGEAIISYTSSSTGCAATRLVTVVAVPAIMGVSNMCAYSAVVTVSDAITGGTWTSTSATVSSAGVVTPYAAGTATLTYTIPLGCYTAATFTVNPLPGIITGADRFCHGLTTTLSDPAGSGTGSTTGGVWSSSNTLVAPIVPLAAGSITVSGLLAGTSVISYVLPTGCMQTDTVIVDSFPVAGVITGLASVCVDASISLSDIAAGGVWSSSNGSATIMGGEVSGVSAGIDTIKYEVSNTCGSAAVEATVTVNPLPEGGSITGASNVCTGDSILLTDAAAGGIWSSGAAVMVTGGTVLGLSVGTDTVKYTVTNVCGIAIAQKPVTVNALPDPGTISGGMDSLCNGFHLTLTDVVTGGAWSSSNSAIINMAGPGLLIAESVGVDTIVYSVTDVCGTASVSAIIVVKQGTVPGVISGADSVCEGEMDTLTGTPQGGTWSSSSSSASVLGGVVSGLSVGADTIMYSITGACGTAVASYPITVLSLNNCDTKASSNSPQGGELLRVWPNPNDGMFTVLLSSGIDEAVQIIITNVVGEKMKELTLVTNKETEILLGAAAGVYFISASTGEGSYVAKVVVE